MQFRTGWIRGQMQTIAVITLSVLIGATAAHGSEWMPVTGAEALNNFMSGIKAERTLPNGTLSRGEYFSDGTGTLYSWGAAIPRSWTVKDDTQICVTAGRLTNCYRIERNSDNPNLFRARDTSGNVTEFQVTDDNQAVVTSKPEDIDDKGGAATGQRG